MIERSDAVPGFVNETPRFPLPTPPEVEGNPAFRRLLEETIGMLKHAEKRHSPVVFLCGRDEECAVLLDLVEKYAPSIQVVQTNAPEPHSPERTVLRLLEGQRGWITADRRDHHGQANLPHKEWDADHLLFRFNPLADWSQQDLDDYFIRHPHAPGS